MSSLDSGMAEDSPIPGTDGPQAFESVAEALHLQWSVIGSYTFCTCFGILCQLYLRFSMT